MRIAVAEAKAQFSELIRRAEAGEVVELTRYGRPVARIIAAGQGGGTPLIGALSGRILRINGAQDGGATQEVGSGPEGDRPRGSGGAGA